MLERYTVLGTSEETEADGVVFRVTDVTPAIGITPAQLAAAVYADRKADPNIFIVTRAIQPYGWKLEWMTTQYDIDPARMRIWSGEAAVDALVESVGIRF